MLARIDDPALPITPQTVLVLVGCGPVGVPGMPEWGMIPIPARLVQAGVTDMVRVTDSRMSGTSFGTVVLHAAPESAVGGPLALVRDGDVIALDVPAGTIDLEVSPAELERPPGRLGPATGQAPARLACPVRQARPAGPRRMRPGFPPGADSGAPDIRGTNSGPFMRAVRMRRERAVRRWKIAAAAAAAALLAAGCGSSSGSGSSGGSSNAPVTLTIWHNYGTEQNATALVNLAKAFHKLHPNITVNVVSQPASNYFALLQAKAISHNGPDLAVMWTGLFTLQYKGFLQNLKGLVPASALAQVDPDALKWTSDSFNAANGPYVIPLENQFYIGFYNKADFAKAGVASVPTDWSQLYAACTKLKKAGYTPMVYGNGGQPLGATFYPWYDMSYMMIGAYSVSQWQGLYSGSTPWTSAAISAQLTNWTKLHSSGCTNPDVVTNTNNLGQFESGKAAMMVDGTWDTAEVHQRARQQRRGVRPAVLRRADQGRRRLRRRRPVDDELLAAQDAGGRVPDLHDHQAGRGDHQRGRAHPGDRGNVDQQPGQPGDAELRRSGRHDGLSDAGQRGPGQRRQHRIEVPAVGA